LKNVLLNIEALQNITHLSCGDIREAIHELKKSGVLVEHRGKRGLFSLDSGKREEIKRLISS